MEPTQAPQPAQLRVGSKVMFPRGMYGQWLGTIRQIYTGRAWHLHRQPMALVSYARANGSFGKKRCFLSSLTPVAK